MGPPSVAFLILQGLGEMFSTSPTMSFLYCSTSVTDPVPRDFSFDTSVADPVARDFSFDSRSRRCTSRKLKPSVSATSLTAENLSPLNGVRESSRSGRRFGAPSGPFRCLGSSGVVCGLQSHRNPLKSVGTASGWCGVGHHHVPARCARGYPRKRPGSTPNPESGSEIAIDTGIRLGVGMPAVRWC
jgi:hypothetical protein